MEESTPNSERLTYIERYSGVQERQKIEKIKNSKDFDEHLKDLLAENQKAILRGVQIASKTQLAKVRTAQGMVLTGEAKTDKDRVKLAAELNHVIKETEQAQEGMAKFGDTIGEQISNVLPTKESLMSAVSVGNPAIGMAVNFTKNLVAHKKEMSQIRDEEAARLENAISDDAIAESEVQPLFDDNPIVEKLTISNMLLDKLLAVWTDDTTGEEISSALQSIEEENRLQRERSQAQDSENSLEEDANNALNVPEMEGPKSFLETLIGPLLMLFPAIGALISAAVGTAIVWLKRALIKFPLVGAIIAFFEGMFEVDEMFGDKFDAAGIGEKLLMTLISGVTNIFQRLAEGIGWIIDSVMSIIGVKTNVAEYFSDDFQKKLAESIFEGYEWTKQKLQEIPASISDWFSNLSFTLPDLGIMEALENLWNSTVGFSTRLVEDVSQGISTKFTEATETVKEFFGISDNGEDSDKQTAEKPFVKDVPMTRGADMINQNAEEVNNANTINKEVSSTIVAPTTINQNNTTITRPERRTTVNNDSIWERAWMNSMGNVVSAF